MKSKLTRVLSVALSGAMILSLAGCGNGSSSSGSSSSGEEERKVVVYATKSDAENATRQKVIEAFTEETGIQVELRTLSGDTADDFQTNLDIAIMGGDDGDVLPLDNNTQMAKYASSGLLLELDDMIDASGEDWEAMYGSYLDDAIDDNGSIVGVPIQSNVWAVYYNKQIFDDAGIDYPTGDWTWSEYVELAQQLTDTDNGIYGSYMLDYDNYLYTYATQLGVSAYKEDGTSNYDDPAFAQALEWFDSLGTVYGIQPSYLEYTTKSLAWDGFMSGKYAMTYISSWYLTMFADLDTYPRDWDWGIVETPIPDEADEALCPSNTGYYAISANGTHTEEAFEFITFWAENAWKYGGQAPARIDLTDEEWSQVFETYVENSGTETTSQEIADALINNGMTMVSEKITGAIPSEYSDIILNNAELYLVGEATLDDTVAAIKKEADEAIADAEADQ